MSCDVKYIIKNSRVCQNGSGKPVQTHSPLMFAVSKTVPLLLQLHEMRTHFILSRVKKDIFPPPLQLNTCSGWMCLNLQKPCFPVTYHKSHSSA